MDEYDKKFAEMQKYIPFLEAMIKRLQNVKDKDNRENQLQKMQSLHEILSNNKQKLKIETLERCEHVLQKLYNRVEKGNTPDLQLQFKQYDDLTAQPSTSKGKSNSRKEGEQSQDAEKDKDIIEETPASPDTARSSSPECQILPIIIPTERDAAQNKGRTQQKQHPNKIPVITLTDNTKTITISSPSEVESNPDDVTYTEWDMLEDSERRNLRNKENRPSLLTAATSHDVATAAKLISNSLPQKVCDNRSYELDPQDIPTVPVPSLGGSRRLSSILEKNKLSLGSLNIVAANSSRTESPVNVPEVRLNSPDPEILFAKPVATSPRSKDSYNTLKPPSKPPSIPLLLSPPLSHEPPLSMEDLAELLSDDGDEKSSESATKKKQEMDKSKNFSLSEREKLATKKNLSSTTGVSPVKSSAISTIGPPHQSNDFHRSTSVFQEPRYANNYERHPRQRDTYSHESAKDKSSASPIIIDEIPSQISVLHNAANKPNERNNPLYQRRPSAPPEGWKDMNVPRQETEFMIDNTDYYSMHSNQMHWSSAPASNDHQFGNTQWTPSSYSGITNSPLQPTQHPFQRPMEPQFRQNQFPPALPTGPIPLMNSTILRPQEMSHVRPENIREDIPPSIPPGFPQYRGFQIGQGSYDSASVGRPTEYPHVRPTWEGPSNRINETTHENVISCGPQIADNSTGTSYPRPNTPYPWGTRDRSNRSQGRDGYYERNRTEVRPSFNRDVRRTDWSRDSHSERENLNRFPNRDPRIRTEHNATGANQMQTKDTGISARDPRLAKDKHVNATTKTKDTMTSHNERDPRKRDPKSVTAKAMATKEKPSSHKSSEKEKTDKFLKDRMQSPLESLYGAIDTKASQKSGLQKFKIPKIKRSEPPQLNRIINEVKDTENTLSKPPRTKSSSNKNNKLCSNKNKDVASAEVSSSSDGNRTTENLIQQNDGTKESKITSSSLDKSDNNEADSATNNSQSSDVAKKSKKKKTESEANGSKPKKEVTQEWIEALIRKSFESGEGKKLVEQAKLLQKLGEALKAKKFKKIKKIIESESESSSDKDETVEAKKTQSKKKRRVIVSDSSDDECLAERLGILNTGTDINDEKEIASVISTDPKHSEEKLELTAFSSNSSKELPKTISAKELRIRDEECIRVDNSSKNKNMEKKNDKNDCLDGYNDNTNVQSESEKLISSEGRIEDGEMKQTEDNQKTVDKSIAKKLKDSTESSIKRLNQDSAKSNTEFLDQSQDQTAQSLASDITSQVDEVSNDKPKTKTKRRNSLEMLQEDIREMFISEDVVMATGYRMCRLSKEGQSSSGMSSSTLSMNSKKDETSNITEKNTETNESVTSNKPRKSLRSRNVEESSKSKAKNKRSIRNLRLQKSALNSDSEEDQPLALRTEKLRNNTPNQEIDHSEESNDALRKSKRVGHKDILKEPRVLVEKADITKIDASKIMFDSSSDESFGIDVSELAAAVDISLRPDKQSDQDSVETVVTLRRRKGTKNVRKRTSKSKKSSALTDDKSEDESFTDEESIISDISMSSNTTIKKKTNGGAARTTAKEELLSNILIGLVPTTEKNTSIDKGNEADYEEDVNDSSVIEPCAKKSLVKKKKKKSSWQMGIVTTKKRKKKTASGVSSKTAQTSVEETNTESNILMNTGQADQSISRDNKPAMAEKIPEKIVEDNHTLIDDTNIDFIVKRELNEINSLVNMDNFGIDFKDLGNFSALSESSGALKETLNESFSIEESKPLIKIEKAIDSSSADLSATSTTNLHTDIANKFFKESSKVIYDELMTELFHRIDIKHLIDYAWGGQDKYKCLLCFFTGKNIVHHYKVTHPGKEVLISRLKLIDAETAIVETERSSTLASTTKTNDQMCKFRCRFCCFVTEGAADVALEAFYEHCTTHTGEYRFHCNNCPYQAVAKASMKTHYYKVCRREKTFNESASEDIIPKEGGIYGYLCSGCNFVQLKRQHVEAHVAFWHREQIGTEILKINMSAVEHAASNNEQLHERASINTEESFTAETKPQVSELDVSSTGITTESKGKDANTNEYILCEPKTEENIEIKEEETEERPRLSQGEPEGPVITGNLSAFVCPPEFENKEIEIQRERQKTMQELANNIGILLKNSKPSLSIIDKLQDKMRTDVVVSPVPESNTLANIPETKENPSLSFVSTSEEPLKSEEELIVKEDPLSQPSTQEDPLSLAEEQLIADKEEGNEVTNDGDDKVDMKIRDPLAIMDPSKDNESDSENSDNEHAAPVFESDSSSEQSDSEQTDVNMILKETSNMNASSSRDPMLTTIQRLAAQLQNVKPLEPMPELDIKMEIKTEPEFFPKPPNVVPIADAKHLLEQNAESSKKETSTSASYSDEASSSTKNFIRFRRLSGDMLSMPTQSLDSPQEDPQESNADGAQSDSAVDAQQTDSEEGCSFLKIENVVSLAPRSDNNESHIVNDIRKVVEISPTKSKEISILRKSNQPLILKKIILPQPLINTNVQAPKQLMTTSLASSSTLNCGSKKFKLIRTLMPSGVTKEIAPLSIKFKSADAYALMLTKPKLSHFYKCMDTNCDFTTDVETEYANHYLKHYIEASKAVSATPRDYEKCAYCYASWSDWLAMKIHLWEKHSHCRYQCGYCFYRAVVPSYVQQHQMTCHPGTVYYSLVGKVIKPVPKQENINRSEYVQPFICKFDCEKIFYIPEAFITHLKTKHSFSMFYKCHLCHTSHRTIELLMAHYKSHEYCKYQCLYCLFGRNTLNEMHQHLSAFHCNRLPQVLERSLPQMLPRDKDVIPQLILRIFDQKSIEGSIDSNADYSKNNTTKKNATNDQISAASLNVKNLNKAQSNQPNTPWRHNVIETISDNLRSTETNADVSNISTKQPADVSLTNVNEKTCNNVAEKQLLQKELCLQSDKEESGQIPREPELELLSSINESSMVNPLKLSGEFNCDDEFVNTNLLDNAELLKNFTPNSGSKLSKSQDKTEDSDIEILDSEEKIAARQENVEDNVKKIAKPVTLEPKIKKDKEQIADINDTSETSTSEDAPSHTANMAANTQSEKPLTLDDIKHTGFTGYELYKCGYLNCNFSAFSSISLKAHIKTCNLIKGEPVKNLFCPHCKKRYVKIGLLLEHIKIHGLKRFECSMCKRRYSVSYQATAHMKQKHKLFSTKLVPADPTNPSAEGLFIVQPAPSGSAERRTKKRKGAKFGTDQKNEKSTDNEKLSFSPDEIDQLPRQAIYNREVQCAVCPYTTKVRTNIIRHLMLHAKDETVPESGPVNPVPCLDKKEKMFDKMVNLASSSHQNGRMGPKPKESIKESEEDDSIPKFVPEHKRYVCGVAECNYLTVDEAMLRYHLKALHSEEPYFRCPHCPPPSPGQENQNIAIDKMGIHLKMHDTRLYKCSHCNHHHYHRHVVERHLADKHAEKRPFVKVIREIENNENVQQPVQEETEEEVPDPDGNHWKCNLCDFKCVYKADVATHADTVHNESSQYKCTLCSFKTSGKILFEQHVNSKHACDTNVDYTLIYQRIKGVNKRNTEATEQSGQDEPFDTTPLWRRNMPRVRHIRGILLEDEEIEEPATSETTSKVSLGKRKSDAEVVTKPAKIKSTGKSTSLDENNKQSKEKSKRSLSCETEGEGQITKENAQSKSDSRGVTIGSKLTRDSQMGELSDVNDSDMGRFGPYGKPDFNLYVCTLCNNFKTRYKHDMRDHLYRELKYPRWHCKTCGYLSVNRKSLLQHFGKRHNGESPEHEPLSPDNMIEDWVMTLLKRQTDMIKAALRGTNVHKITATSTGANSSSPNVSPVKVSTDKKTVNLASAITNLQSDILEENRSSIDTDGDSQDEELVIDMKEDEDRSNDDGSESDKLREKTDDDLEKPIVCKHCQMTFSRQRGFKLHVQFSHLKRFTFLCPYCDRSSNSEVTIRQHIHAKHPNDPEKVIHNPDAWGNAKLNDEFWEKEYGLCPLKTTKKRKLNVESNAAASTAAISVSTGYRIEKCEICNFTAMNHTGLTSHMRIHANKHNFKCMHCTYTCIYKAEMLEHCELNHPKIKWKFKEIQLLSTTGSPSDETKNKPSTSQKSNVDASKNVEEERDPAQSIVYYGCFYCDLRSNSLSSIKQHWNLMHKELKSSDTTFSTKLPFRYKEISVQKLSIVSPTKKDVTRHETENLSPLVVQLHGWICQWCQEFCETNNDRIRHQNMFHSHLPHKWQKQQQKAQDQSKDISVQLSECSAEKYARLTTNSKNVSGFESIVENLITKHVKTEYSDMKNKNQSRILDTSTSEGDSSDGLHGVARKSTTKSVISYARPGPRVFKAVARKSTNPRPSVFTVPRLPPADDTDTEFEEDEEEEEEVTRNKPFSYYGKPSSPINLAELNTHMVVGGHNMRVTCLNLATLIDIKPKVLLKDIRKDPKYVASLSNLD
ncbi:uncharacterized protein LOC105830364 isoform X2 [Monomorium pharaonis]|uniref:uncharacterized protein LOC105830364 isoform X2 n=1 Tax=Monomorium pharaonis TaxID=307658 RepID=UPI001746B4EA|nr:uncharacterized protein LOC105830364 isoform X2 [Monomorium pharaonis]